MTGPPLHKVHLDSTALDLNNASPSTESVRIHLEASATALRKFYSTSLSAGVSNVLKILQTNITGIYLLVSSLNTQGEGRSSRCKHSPSKDVMWADGNRPSPAS